MALGAGATGTFTNSNKLWSLLNEVISKSLILFCQDVAEMSRINV